MTTCSRRQEHFSVGNEERNGRENDRQMDGSGAPAPFCDFFVASFVCKMSCFTDKMPVKFRDLLVHQNGEKRPLRERLSLAKGVRSYLRRKKG